MDLHGPCCGLRHFADHAGHGVVVVLQDGNKALGHEWEAGAA